MSGTVDDTVKVKIKANEQIILQGGHYILVDTCTLETQADGTYVAVGERKFAGLFWDGTMEQVIVKYDSEGKFVDYDSLLEE